MSSRKGLETVSPERRKDNQSAGEAEREEEELRGSDGGCEWESKSIFEL